MAKAEKVVKPPSTPVTTKWRTSGLAAGMRASQPLTAPMASEPAMLTARVDSGSRAVAPACDSARPREKRSTEPAAPPRATTQSARPMRAV